MNDIHLSSEELVDLYYESSNESASSKRNHLDECEICRTEYEAISEVLDRTSRLPAPALAPSERVRMFEQAWSERRGAMTKGWNLWSLFRKPALTFALGIACGLFFATVGIERETLAAKPAVRVDTYNSTQTVRGEAVKKTYPFLEDPVIVVDKNSDGSEEPHRVLYGTTDNGSIQIVLNL